MSSKMPTPAEFARNYVVDPTLPKGEVFADFLFEGARVLPYRYFENSLVAKVVYRLDRTPSEDSPLVKSRLKSLRVTANDVMTRKHPGHELVVDMVEGVRASVDDNDLYKTNHRKKQRRFAQVEASLRKTDSHIRISKLDSHSRSELAKCREAMRQMGGPMEVIRALPAHDPKDEE